MVDLNEFSNDRVMVERSIPTGNLCRGCWLSASAQILLCVQKPEFPWVGDLIAAGGSFQGLKGHDGVSVGPPLRQMDVAVPLVRRPSFLCWPCSNIPCALPCSLRRILYHNYFLSTSCVGTAGRVESRLLAATFLLKQRPCA